MSGDLSAVREVWAQRSGARTGSDVLYLLYLGALSVLVLGVPALRFGGALLARPDVLPVLQHPLAPRLAGIVVLIAAAALVLLGGVRGPALMAPFFTTTLASSGIRRRTVLWRPYVRALLAPTASMAVVASLIAVTLRAAGGGDGAAGGGADGAAAVRFVLAATGAGLLLGAAWLAGELLTARPRRLLVGALLLAGGLSALLPQGTGLGGSWPGAEAPHGPGALLVLGAGIAATAAGITLLDRLRGTVLREQSMRWESVTTVATSGDLAGAAATFRPPPSAGRRLRAVGPRPLVLLYARRDAVAWLRSPDRLVVGIVVALLAAAALAGSTQLTGPLAGGAVLLGAVALWGAGSTLVEGIRHGVHTLGAPRLFGQTVAVQVLLHALAPALLLTALAALGGGGLVLAGGIGEGALRAVLLPVALAPVLIAGQVRDAAKGPMPLQLMTPMPTAQGDSSVLVMLAWQSDALLLALLAGTLLAGLGLLGPVWTLGGAALLTALMALMARGRLRALGS
ncbi:hypothetical protein CFK38_14770 [Brachybacterium vulturis]|uniref:Uncharacterized protein n=1 Tax=Brachybacterium vulturis TaxID=2017484 RepID=A0A291GR36_9MICO|nr:hypothetical protein [Brachybacterium vulturis]ATG52647.1 hypothetical protein CFK38_14770 [Brachybacterium vulturis]